MPNPVSPVVTDIETKPELSNSFPSFILHNKYAQYNFAILVGSNCYDTLPSNSSLNTEKIHMGDLTPVTVYNKYKSDLSHRKYAFVSTEGLKAQLIEQGYAIPEDFEE